MTGERRSLLPDEALERVRSLEAKLGEVQEGLRSLDMRLNRALDWVHSQQREAKPTLTVLVAEAAKEDSS